MVHTIHDHIIISIDNVEIIENHRRVCKFPSSHIFEGTIFYKICGIAMYGLVLMYVFSNNYITTTTTQQQQQQQQQ